MRHPGTVSKIGNLYASKALFVEFATVDIGRELASRDTMVFANPASVEAQQAIFEKAYLYNTAGDRNAIVTTYNSIIERYPGTLSEADALFRLGDLCYEDRLVSNSADYYNRGLQAYGELLGRRGDIEPLNSAVILHASERLQELAVELDENYFVNLYKLYVNVPLKLDEFPQLFFTFGVALKKLGDMRFAGKCFTETENRLIELMDEALYQEMKAKIDIVRANARAVLSASKIKQAVTPDGVLSEWKRADALSISRRDNVIVNQMRWLDRTDISGSFYAGYDQYNLYFAGEISDDRVFRQDRANGDYIGIYLDLRDGAGDYLTRHREIGEGVYSLKVIPPASAGEGFRVESDREMQPMVGGMMTADGYVFELTVPLPYLKGFSPSKGKRIGLGIELFDLDSGGGTVPPKVMGWLMPTRSAYGPRFSELFGILEF
jgi:hypothetical protein